MTLVYRVTAPPGMHVEEDFDGALGQILLRAEVPFEIKETDSTTERTLILSGTEEVEARYVLRLLQRAGYDLNIREMPSK